ncbi:hypothetical protein [Streptomyces sp. H51]|uniref:hypothetical protein n=1 Tax=Streptomyces sp. H51 TaxID=3111770 RepID=UPI002D77F395|nr:hypothetical protein [Streptomyces sp. H51]
MARAEHGLYGIAATGEGTDVLAAAPSGTAVPLAPSAEPARDAASRTDALPRAERQRPMKDTARLRCAVNRSPHRKA